MTLSAKATSMELPA
jgi:hypothetical protein